MLRRVHAAMASGFATALVLVALSCTSTGGGSGAHPPPVVSLPTIAATGQPQSATVWTPAPATFTVQATSGGGTLTYQWRRNGADIAGAFQSSFNTGPTNVNDFGATFQVAVSNEAGTVVSTVATLTVNEKPTIQQNPGSISVLEGQPATFLVRAQGSPVLHYQWKRNGTAIPGGTSSTYTIPATQISDDGAVFTVDVSNVLDSTPYSITSAPAQLRVGTLLTPPTITQQPTDISLMVGQTGMFVVVATGTAPLQYQWRKNGVNITGATASSLSIIDAKDTDAGTFDVVVQNAAGTVTSTAVTLTVLVTPPAITAQPADAVVGTGQTAQFSVTAIGSLPLQYQWRKNDVDIPGANASSYTTPAALLSDDGSFFTVRVWNSAGSVISQHGLLQVYVARTLSGQVGTLFESASGENSVGRDIRAVNVELQQSNTHGTFSHFAAQGQADGTFIVSGVPPGAFYAFVPGVGPTDPVTGLWTTNEFLDLRRMQTGRADGVPVTSSQVDLAMTLQGPVIGNFSSIELLTPTLGLVLEQQGTGPLFRFQWLGLPVIEAAKDTVWLTTLKSQTTGPATKTTLTGAIQIPPFSMTTFNETILHPNPSPAVVPQDQSIQWRADSDAYANLLPAVGAPSLTITRGPLHMDLLAQPYGFNVGAIPPWPTILGFSTTATGSVNSGALTYGDPFPAEWGRVVRLRQEFSFDLPVPGHAQPAHVNDALQEVWPMPQGGWPPAVRTPIIGPVTQPTVNGVNFFSPPASVGLTPVFRWNPRPLDQTSYYIVTIFLVNPNDSSLRSILEVSTEVPSLTVGDGYLQSGSQYVARILSVQSSAYDPNLPWRATWPMITVPVYSAVLQP